MILLHSCYLNFLHIYIMCVINYVDICFFHNVESLLSVANRIIISFFLTLLLLILHIKSKKQKYADI